MTPPTYSPWWKPLELLARFGFARLRPPGSPGPVGDFDADCTGDQGWRDYLEPRRLFEAWSPPQDSPWSAYAKPTLFAALPGKTDRVWPIRPAPAGPPPALPRPPEGAAVLLDLPGPLSVAYGAWLARAAGFQPVPLFNNWPHPKGVVDAGRVLGALLHYVPWAAEGADLRGAAAPPAFLLDRDRLGRHAPAISDFDNRYFHNEADLPSAAILRRNGIRRLLYVKPDPATEPSTVAPPPTDWTARLVPPAPGTVVPLGVDEMDDLNAYLCEARKSVGLGLATASGSLWRLDPAKEFGPRPRKTPFSTTRDPAFLGFRRSGAGGFGRIVPDPRQGGFG